VGGLAGYLWQVMGWPELLYILYSTGGTLKHLSTYLPLISLISLSALSPTSLIPLTPSFQTGPQADAHWEATPLRGGVKCQGLPSLIFIPFI